MLVSVAIFSIVMTLALGSLLALSVADRKAETLKSGVDNVTFALDSMSRAIRTGSNYHCGSSGTLTSAQNCPSGANYFTFLASNGVQTTYLLDTLNTYCGQTQAPYGCIERSTDGGTTWIPITSPDIIVQNVGNLFYVTGAATGDGVQPKVTVTVNSSIPVSTTQSTNVFMQTTATQRIYDQ